MASRTVLTCAHVAARALDADMRGSAPAGSATVDFPGSVDRSALDVSVDPSGWLPVDAPGGGDLALLRLAADPPGDVHPASLRECGDPAGRQVQAFGHPAGLDAGAWARARLVGYGGPGPGWIQFDGVDTTGRAIAGGFSGAGVVEAGGHVIGLVVAEDPEPAARVAWMIPVEVCFRRLPALAGLADPVGLADPAGRETADPGMSRPRVSAADLHRLADALSEVPAIRDADSRSQIIAELRPAIAGSVRHHSSRTMHVFNLLRTCLDHPGGLTEFIGVVRLFADGSASFRQVEHLIAEMGLDGV